MSLTVKSVTSSESLNQSFNTFLLDCTGGDITFTLNDISASDGQSYIIKRIDASEEYGITIAGYDSSQTIDGQTTFFVGINVSRRLISFGGIWHTVY